MIKDNQHVRGSNFSRTAFVCIGNKAFQESLYESKRFLVDENFHHELIENKEEAKEFFFS